MDKEETPTLPELSRPPQRIFQIACGYEDQNDLNFLREDPLLKVVCGSLPESGADLASQPTFSRLENAVDIRCCYGISQALFELYLRERGRDGIPNKVLLDFDSRGRGASRGISFGTTGVPRARARLAIS